MNILFSLFCGILLSAACGFRVFVPFLAINIGARLGYIDLPSNFEWIGSKDTLTFFIIATLVEIIGSYVPLVDSGLKLLTTPIAIIGGIIMLISFVAEISPQIDPLLRWTLALSIGGSIAGTTHILTGSTRLLTGGIGGDPIVSTVEPVASIVCSFVGIATSIFVLL